MSLTKLPKELVDNLETALDSKQNASELGDAAFADILGIVSQSGGVPTGAIIERGSNDDGSYTIFADGRIISEKEFVISADFAFDNIFRTSEYFTWTFPVEFSEPPVVTGAGLGGATGVWAGGRAITAVSCEPELMASRARLNQSAKYTAIGKRY